MDAAPDSRPLRCVTIAYLGLVAVFAVGACIVALRDQMTVLFADDWRMLDHYQSRPLLQYLFGAENGHRLPATLALFAIDYEWLGGRMRTLVLASIACTALTTGLLWRIFWRQGALDRAPARSVLGFASFALFWAVSCNDLLRGIYHMSLQTRPPEHPPPAFLVLADRSGVIRGLADFASVPPYQRAGPRDDALAWTGFVADYDPAERYTAYAVLGDGRSACPLRAP
jgi:hypothetical protein